MIVNAARTSARATGFWREYSPQCYQADTELSAGVMRGYLRALRSGTGERFDEESLELAGRAGCAAYVRTVAPPSQSTHPARTWFRAA
jgi:hypothetical protein